LRPWLWLFGLGRSRGSRSSLLHARPGLLRRPRVLCLAPRALVTPRRVDPRALRFGHKVIGGGLARTSPLSILDQHLRVPRHSGKRLQPQKDWPARAPRLFVQHRLGSALWTGSRERQKEASWVYIHASCGAAFLRGLQ